MEVSFRDGGAVINIEVVVDPEHFYQLKEVMKTFFLDQTQ